MNIDNYFTFIRVVLYSLYISNVAPIYDILNSLKCRILKTVFIFTGFSKNFENKVRLPV